MPKTQLYQLFDNEAETVLGPIVADLRDQPAIRTFHEILADDKTIPGRYPEQFRLLHLGTQDTTTGLIDANTIPRIVASGEDWKKAQDARAQRGRAVSEEVPAR